MVVLLLLFYYCRVQEGHKQLTISRCNLTNQFDSAVLKKQQSTLKVVIYKFACARWRSSTFLPFCFLMPVIKSSLSACFFVLFRSSVIWTLGLLWSSFSLLSALGKTYFTFHRSTIFYFILCFIAETPSAPFLDLTVLSDSSIYANFSAPLSDGGAAINSYKVCCVLLMHCALFSTSNILFHADRVGYWPRRARSSSHYY